MFGYLLWSVAALCGAVCTLKLLFAIPTDSRKLKVYVFYTVIHAILLSGAIIMTLGLFNLNLSWPGKLIILAVVVVHNSFTLWQLNRDEK